MLQKCQGRESRPGASEHDGLLWKKTHPMGMLILGHRSEPSRKATEGARSQLGVTDAHFQPVPPRGRGEVPEGDRRVAQIRARLNMHLLEVAKPPTEGAAKLHLPLELDAHANLETLEALQHSVRVRRQGRLWRLGHRGAVRDAHVVDAAAGLGQAGLELHPGGHRAEAQPVSLAVGNGLGHHLAGAQVAGDVGVEFDLVLDARRHGSHREAKLLLPVEDLEGALQPASQRLLE
mmetsp:Transcript_123511/g.395055  ORF Transcript_123511/g.395055 Transcript_123511/m.395055 type:complete len:234 (-) Transcript_123511:981-1682(-)